MSSTQERQISWKGYPCVKHQPPDNTQRACVAIFLSFFRSGYGGRTSPPSGRHCPARVGQTGWFTPHLCLSLPACGCKAPAAVRRSQVIALGNEHLFTQPWRYLCMQEHAPWESNEFDSKPGRPQSQHVRWIPHYVRYPAILVLICAYTICHDLKP